MGSPRENKIRSSANARWVSQKGSTFRMIIEFSVGGAESQQAGKIVQTYKGREGPLVRVPYAP